MTKYILIINRHNYDSIRYSIGYTSLYSFLNTLEDLDVLEYVQIDIWFDSDTFKCIRDNNFPFVKDGVHWLAFESPFDLKEYYRLKKEIENNVRQ